MDQTKTLRLRIKDKHCGVLSMMAREVNFVWNYCNETSYRAIRERYDFFLVVSPIGANRLRGT